MITLPALCAFLGPSVIAIYWGYRAGRARRALRDALLIIQNDAINAELQGYEHGKTMQRWVRELAAEGGIKWP